MARTKQLGGFTARGVHLATVQSILGANSTTTPLAGSATFTGQAEFIDTPDVAVSCKTDQDGTLFFDFSNDGGANYDTFPSAGFEVHAGIHEFHTAVKLGRDFRVRLVNNSASVQSYLRLYTYYGTFRAGNAPVNQTLGNDADATVVRTFPQEVDRALGRLGGVSQRDKFGYAPDLGIAIQAGDTGSWSDLWFYGGLRTAPLASFTPYHASTSAADTGVVISHLYQDTGGHERTVTVNLNGQTPVSLGVTATELYRSFVSGDKPIAGTVTAVRDTGGYSSGTAGNNEHVLTAVPVHDNQSQVLAFRVPSDKKALLTNINLYLARSNGSAGSADVVLQTRATGGVWRTVRAFEISTSAPIQDMLNAILDPLTDVRVRIRDVSDASSVLSGDLSYLLIDI